MNKKQETNSQLAGGNWQSLYPESCALCRQLTINMQKP